MLATVVLLLADDIQLHLLLGETYIEYNDLDFASDLPN